MAEVMPCPRCGHEMIIDGYMNFLGSLIQGQVPGLAFIHSKDAVCVISGDDPRFYRFTAQIVARAGKN